jgi:hypothetical protein
MNHRTLTLGCWFFAVVLLNTTFLSAPVAAQAPGNRASAQGSLTVTLTVVSSVGVVTGPDGEQRIIVANAADPKDNVSSLQMVRVVTLTPASDPQPSTKPAKTKRKKP